MSSSPISGLTNYPAPSSVNDVLPIVDTTNNQTKKIPVSNLGWNFLGSATAAAVTVGPVITTNTYRQYMIYYFIAGYAGGTPIGRLLWGAGTPSTTAATNGSNIREAAVNVAAFTVTSLPVSIPGVPLAITSTNISRAGVCFVDGASGQFKSYQITGMNGSASVSAAPSQFLGVGWFSDLGTNLPLKQFQLTVYDLLTSTSASATAFAAGTYLAVWGRNTF